MPKKPPSISPDNLTELIASQRQRVEELEAALVVRKEVLKELEQLGGVKPKSAAAGAKAKTSGVAKASGASRKLKDSFPKMNNKASLPKLIIGLMGKRKNKQMSNKEVATILVKQKYVFPGDALRFVTQQMYNMKSNGLLESVPGATGTYRLPAAAAQK